MVNPTVALLPWDGTEFCPRIPHPFLKITSTPTVLKPHLTKKRQQNHHALAQSYGGIEHKD